MKTRIQELEKLIQKHKNLYYQGKAEISDEAFDKLEEELRNLDPENPVLKEVGSKSIGNLPKVAHQKKMLSLDKTYSEDDLKKWAGKEDVLSIFKIDGSSCSLIYENGELLLGKTRGDGSVGENITRNVIHINNIPHKKVKLDNFEVRGEVFCREEDFFKLSEEMVKRGLEAPTSQRNIVAGLLGRKENNDLSKFLTFQAFDLISDKKFEKEHQKLDELKSLGFEIPEYVIHKKLHDVEERIQEAKEFMANGDYLIDGLVFVFENIKLHDELGETSHHPKYKKAFKFAGDTKIAKIDHLEWGVSRNGLLTPVAIIEPTELSGAVITRVTLHNFGMVKNFKLKAGDRIEIIRSGEVIPKFLSVVESSKEAFTYPNECVSCGSKLEVHDIWLMCKNPVCPDKIKEDILNYIHKAGIDDISTKRLEELINKGFVEKIPDLYRLSIEDFLTLDKVKEKLANKMFENISKTKKQKLSRFITAIGVEGVSFTKSEKIIAAGFNTLEKFINISFEEMVKIEGFAEKSSASIVRSLGEKKNLVEELLSVGVEVEKDEASVGEGNLNGLKFCITGELSEPRPQIEKLIKANGGLIAGVSKNLNYLVTNETDSSSSKFKKAQELKVEIINEETLRKMIEG